MQDIQLDPPVSALGIFDLAAELGEPRVESTPVGDPVDQFGVASAAWACRRQPRDDSGGVAHISVDCRRCGARRSDILAPRFKQRAAKRLRRSPCASGDMSLRM